MDSLDSFFIIHKLHGNLAPPLSQSPSRASHQLPTTKVVTSTGISGDPLHYFEASPSPPSFLPHQKDHHIQALAAELYEKYESHSFSWSTCLRSILFGWGPQAPHTLEVASLFSLSSPSSTQSATPSCHPTHPSRATVSPPSTPIQIYQGVEAYHFCLEVLCGLHSPLVGETEVFGQFKNFLKSQTFSPTDQQMRTTLENLCKDAKKIRQKHLRSIGSQSYGSIVRRLIPKDEDLHILGGGHLVQKILPWIQPIVKETFIHCRNPEKVHAKLYASIDSRLEDKNSIHIKPLDLLKPISPQGSLVIAAPLPCSQIASWMEFQNLSYIVDFRSESQQDPLSPYLKSPSNLKTKDLWEIFEELEKTKNQLLALLPSIQMDLKNLSENWGSSKQIRPFGWDDIDEASL